MTIIDQILDYVADRVNGERIEEAYFIDLRENHKILLPNFLLDEFVIRVREFYPNIFEEGEYSSEFMTEEACHLIIEFMMGRNIGLLEKIYNLEKKYNTFSEFYIEVRKELIHRMNFRQNGETTYCALTGVLLDFHPSDDNEIISNLTQLNNIRDLTLEEYQWLLTIPDSFWETDKDGQELLQKIFQRKIDDGSLFLRYKKPPPMPIS